MTDKEFNDLKADRDFLDDRCHTLGNMVMKLEAQLNRATDRLMSSTEEIIELRMAIHQLIHNHDTQAEQSIERANRIRESRQNA
jgi:hypothetical protein